MRPRSGHRFALSNGDDDAHVALVVLGSCNHSSTFLVPPFLSAVAAAAASLLFSTQGEDEYLLALVSEHNQRWSKVAKEMAKAGIARTDNMCLRRFKKLCPTAFDAHINHAKWKRTVRDRALQSYSSVVCVVCVCCVSCAAFQMHFYVFVCACV